MFDFKIPKTVIIVLEFILPLFGNENCSHKNAGDFNGKLICR